MYKVAKISHKKNIIIGKNSVGLFKHLHPNKSNHEQQT